VDLGEQNWALDFDIARSPEARAGATEAARLIGGP
jgi:hypothetical protein